MATVYGSNSSVYQGRRRSFTPENGTAEEREWRGPANKIAATFDATVGNPGADLSRFASLESEEINGRGRLVARYATVGQIGAGDIGQRDDTVEELYAVDVIKDIRQHPSFDANGTHPLTPDDLKRVNSAIINDKDENWDGGWTAGMIRLHRMLQHGMDSYLETAFILRQSVYGARKKAVKASFENINKLVPVTQVALSAPMLDAIEALPSGQWLKKPATAEYLGRGRWRISLEYMWAEKWHAIYSSTGQNAVTGALDWGDA